METGTFVFRRFNGVEIFRVGAATIEVIEEDSDLDLFFYVNTKGKPIQTLPDTGEWPTQPNAEVYVTPRKFDASKFVGRRFSVQQSWSEAKDDHVSCVYYYGHQDLNKNVIRILERDENRFLVRWTGITADVAHYDGSKPETKVEIKAWFAFKHLQRWIRKMSGPKA